MSRGPSSMEILLVEPSSMVGGIVISTARQLKLPRVRQVGTVRHAQTQLEAHEYDGLIVALDDDGLAIEMLRNLRMGGFHSDPALPVAVVAPQMDSALAAELKTLHVRRILLKPFKVRDLITTIEALMVLAPAPSSATL